MPKAERSSDKILGDGVFNRGQPLNRILWNSPCIWHSLPDSLESRNWWQKRNIFGLITHYHKSAETTSNIKNNGFLCWIHYGFVLVKLRCVVFHDILHRLQRVKSQISEVKRQSYALSDSGWRNACCYLRRWVTPRGPIRQHERRQTTAEVLSGRSDSKARTLENYITNEDIQVWCVIKQT